MATVAPGSTTTEFQLTKWVTLAGMVVTLLAGCLSQLMASGLIPDGSKVGTIVMGVISVCGMLMTLLKALGYTSARTALKTVALQVQATAAVVNPAVPQGSP